MEVFALLPLVSIPPLAFPALIPSLSSTLVVIAADSEVGDGDLYSFETVNHSDAALALARSTRATSFYLLLSNGTYDSPLANNFIGPHSFNSFVRLFIGSPLSGCVSFSSSVNYSNSIVVSYQLSPDSFTPFCSYLTTARNGKNTGAIGSIFVEYTDGVYLKDAGIEYYWRFEQNPDDVDNYLAAAMNLQDFEAIQSMISFAQSAVQYSLTSSSSNASVRLNSSQLVSLSSSIVQFVHLYPTTNEWKAWCENSVNVVFTRILYPAANVIGFLLSCYRLFLLKRHSNLCRNNICVRRRSGRILIDTEKSAPGRSSPPNIRVKIQPTQPQQQQMETAAYKYKETQFDANSPTGTVVAAAQEMELHSLRSQPDVIDFTASIARAVTVAPTPVLQPRSPSGPELESQHHAISLLPAAFPDRFSSSSSGFTRLSPTLPTHTAFVRHSQSDGRTAKSSAQHADAGSALPIQIIRLERNNPIVPEEDIIPTVLLVGCALTFLTGVIYGAVDYDACTGNYLWIIQSICMTLPFTCLLLTLSFFSYVYRSILLSHFTLHIPTFLSIHRNLFAGTTLLCTAVEITLSLFRGFLCISIWNSVYAGGSIYGVCFAAISIALWQSTRKTEKTVGNLVEETLGGGSTQQLDRKKSRLKYLTTRVYLLAVCSMIIPLILINFAMNWSWSVAGQGINLFLLHIMVTVNTFVMLSILRVQHQTKSSLIVTRT